MQYLTNSEQIRSGRKAKADTKKDSASFKTQNEPYRVGLVFLIKQEQMFVNKN
jgi:hypothetical protein